MVDAPNPEAQTWQRWKAALDFALKDKKYTEWLQKCEKINKRYRDDREAPAEIRRRRMNILWSNVQTLLPAVYAKAPKPIVERRFLDRDEAARLASTILERTLSMQLEVSGFHDATKRGVLDWLLGGMGQVWVRYEPQFTTEVEAAENTRIQTQEQKSSNSEDKIQENGDGTPYQKLAYEKVCVDYVFYKDFLWGSSRFWTEVPWVGRRVWLTRSEIAEKFYKGDMQAASRITLDTMPERLRDDKGRFDDGAPSFFRKAEIWEIWNKADQTVYFMAPGTPDIVLQQEKNPVLQLQDFWPCPRPLYATQTNETLVPVPDYVEYQDQAAELDDLTGRISALTTALRANGVYDSSIPQLARLLQDGQDNKLVPVDQWAAFAEKGGIPGAISLVPIKEIADVLLGLYQARAQVKSDLFEVTGMSDIVRGQSDGGAKTATEQRIKGQFASMRLEDRRSEVARFCRDTIAIMAEIISEMFSDDSLMQMSGVSQMFEEDVKRAVEEVPPPQEPEFPPDMPPEQQQMMMQQAQEQAAQEFQQAQQQAAQQAQQKAMGNFQRAIEILRSDKLRGFRVDIETDSTIAADLEADKQGAVELVRSTFEGLMGAGQIVMQAPELLEPMGQLLMFAYRRFRVGRTVEASLEDALDQMGKRLQQQQGQPPPSSPEEIKAQAEMQKQEAETKRDEQKHQFDMQAKAADFEMEQKRNAVELAKAREELEIERERLAMKREEMEIQRETMLLKAQIDAQSASMRAEASEREHMLNRESAEHGHDLNMQTMEAKAHAAQQQARAKPKEKA
ncbi:hypothetical protein [Shinella sp. JR1-6]|uniref:hypothetical protein n=1 Tax=Shinella sp. JR1-6 TaxID=2527671 RepID=UPI00102D47D5|nr:hypothetical protein [Shinella sp. JR1-6]TAA50997.1 hypothetical protein EXZ48_32120 [Shinella sp. JR1-6]